MATSQNGWGVLFSPPSALMRWITGRIRPGDVQTVFDYLCTRLNAEVEANKPGWSWGWAVRAIRGQTSGYSNHASATAIDYNAPAHPLGRRDTWGSVKEARVRQILRDLQGVIRWGEDWSRPDGMHFEVAVGAAELARVANLIRAKKLPGQRPDWKPDHAKAVHFGRVQEQFLIAAGVSDGKIIPNLNGVGLIQKVLNRLYPDLDLTVDGICGEATLNAWGRWEDDVKDDLSPRVRRGLRLGRPRIPDRTSFEALAKKAQWDAVGEPWDD